MGFRDSLRLLFYQVRAIPHKLELRPYRVFVVVTTSSGDRYGQGDRTEVVTEITEADNAPPRVRQMSAEEIAVGGYDANTIEIGPVTPDYPGGGTPLSTLAPDPDVKNATVRIRVVGPRWPDGAHFLIKETHHAKTFGYKLVCERAAD